MVMHGTCFPTPVCRLYIHAVKVLKVKKKPGNTKFKEFLNTLEKATKGCAKVQVMMRHRLRRFHGVLSNFEKRAEQAVSWVEEVMAAKPPGEPDSKWMGGLLVAVFMCRRAGYRERWWEVVLGVLGDSVKAYALGGVPGGRSVPKRRNHAARELTRIWQGSRQGWTNPDGEDMQGYSALCSPVGENPSLLGGVSTFVAQMDRILNGAPPHFQAASSMVVDRKSLSWFTIVLMG